MSPPVPSPASASHDAVSPLKAILRLALPLATAQLGQAMMSLTDTAIVGRTHPAELAGVALGNSIYFTVFVLCMGAVIGMEPIVSQAVGACDDLRARRGLRQGLALAGLVAVPGTLLISLVLELLPHLGLEPEIVTPTQHYVVGRLPGLLPSLAFLALRGYLQAYNVTRPAVVATVVGVLVNVPADFVLVLGDDGLIAMGGRAAGISPLGAAGAGMATAIVNVAQMLVLLRPVHRLRDASDGRNRRERLRAALMQRDELLRIVRVGTPMGMQFAFEVAFFSSVSFLMGTMGALPLAAHQVALTLATIPFHACLGIGSATSVVVGQRIGAADSRGAARAGYAGMGVGLLFMALSGLVFLLFPAALVRLCTDDATVESTATVLVRIAGFFALSDGVQAVASGALRGAGDTLWPFAIHLTAHWVIGMPTALLLAYALHLDAVGLWWGLTTGLTVSAGALALRFRSKARHGFVALEPHPVQRG